MDPEPSIGNSTTESNEHPTDYIYAGCVLGIAGLLGVLTNGLGIYTVKRCAHLHNSFGYLCLSHCIANSGVCATFLLWCAPTTLAKAEMITSEEIGKRIGQVNVFFWDACVYSHFSISINRFICITFPMKAGTFFTPRIIGLFIGIPWVLAVFHITPYFWVNECFIAYDAMSWTWNFAVTECGTIISIYFDFTSGMVVMGAMICVDMCTLFNLRKLHKEAALSSKDSSQKRSLETKFFMQSLCQSAIFALELSSFYFISAVARNQWQTFLLTTFAWVACHAADGLILDLFHAKKALARVRERNVSVVSSKKERSTGTLA